MLSRSELRKLARARLKDAEVLFVRYMHDGAAYLCGYVVELALKARICATLHWTEYPATGGEFKGLGTLKTHDLDILLRLSGRNEMIKGQHLPDWSACAQWNPESRYKPIGTVTRSAASDMIPSAAELLRVL